MNQLINQMKTKIFRFIKNSDFLFKERFSILLFCFFIKNLIQCKRTLVEKLGIDESKLELSMGMSNDYETAVKVLNIERF